MNFPKPILSSVKQPQPIPILPNAVTWKKMFPADECRSLSDCGPRTAGILGIGSRELTFCSALSDSEFLEAKTPISFHPKLPL